MEFTIPKIVIYLLAWSGVMTIIWNLFSRLETVLDKKVLKRLSKWLLNDQSFDSKDWPTLFISLFDKVFGKNHSSWKCFIRSSIGSVITVIIITFILYSAYPDKLKSIDEISIYDILNFWSFTFFLNLIPDYFSLLVTRFILKLIPTKSEITKFIFLILDFLLTFLLIFLYYIIYLSLYLLLAKTDLSFDYLISSVINLLDIMSKLLFFSDQVNFDVMKFSPWFFSTFFTSIWLWLFFIGSVALKYLNKITNGIQKFKSLFDLESKPLRGLGFMCMILVTIIFVVLPFI